MLGLRGVGVYYGQHSFMVHGAAKRIFVRAWSSDVAQQLCYSVTFCIFGPSILILISNDSGNKSVGVFNKHQT